MLSPRDLLPGRLAVLAGAVVALTVGVLASLAPAQPAAGLRHVVVLSLGVNPPSAPFYRAFEDRLRELGWVPGQTLSLEFLAPTPAAGLLDVAKAAVRRKPDLILTAGPEESLLAARQATIAIPIVMVAINYDPVAKGHIASLGRPGGNVTGVFYRHLEVDAKLLELLAQILPKGARVAVIWESNSADQLRQVESTARAMDIAIQKIEVPRPYDFAAAFESAHQRRVQGVLVLGSPVTFHERARIARLALRHRLPCAGTSTMASDSDLLLGFGPDLNALFRLGADYVDRILKGTRPADLPVEQPTKFEMIVNLKTAKVLGLTIPPSLLARADQVIE